MPKHAAKLKVWNIELNNIKCATQLILIPLRGDTRTDAGSDEGKAMSSTEESDNSGARLASLSATLTVERFN